MILTSLVLDLDLLLALLERVKLKSTRWIYISFELVRAIRESARKELVRHIVMIAFNKDIGKSVPGRTRITKTRRRWKRGKSFLLIGGVERETTRD